MVEAVHFDEGLGTVYERFMINEFFEDLLEKYNINNVLEVPIYGMSGLTGINSVYLAEKGCKVTLLESKKDKVDEANDLWQMLSREKKGCKILLHKNYSKLPFNDRSFDLVWNFAAIWHVKDAELLLQEMVRVSANLVIIFVPNKRQFGYLFRKYILKSRFFENVDEDIVEIRRIVNLLDSYGVKITKKGLLDIPPWPDTCFPIKDLFVKLGLAKREDKEETSRAWTWNIMNYYLGEDADLREKIDKYSFIERMALPHWLKALWAHHNYIIFSKN